MIVIYHVVARDFGSNNNKYFFDIEILSKRSLGECLTRLLHFLLPDYFILCEAKKILIWCQMVEIYCGSVCRIFRFSNGDSVK